MKLPINLLFSSTVQWNVGDEFILRGVLNVLRDLGVPFNPVLFNRNPATNTPWQPRFAWPPRPDVPSENSARLDETDPVDYVVFAGTPEWCGGPRASRLHRFICEHDLRCAFLGVGLSSRETLVGDIVTILRRHTDLFVGRDTHAVEAARPHIEPLRHSCPAILCCRSEQLRRAPGRIGFVLQHSKTLWQSVPVEVRDYMIRELQTLAKRFDVVCIAHYLDDLALARSLGLPCRYSFRSEDYEAFFSDCDLVIGARVHGAGIAASMGIPGILISHDERAETALGFGALVVPPGTSLLPLVRETNWETRSREIIALKHAARDFYRAQLATLPPWRETLAVGSAGNRPVG